MDSTEQLLKELTEAHGVPGHEADVRALMRRYLEPLGSLEQDKIGSLVCRQAGTAEGPRVMLAAHMDEIGFMVRYVTKEGFLKFIQLGGWFDQVLLGQLNKLALRHLDRLVPGAGEDKGENNYAGDQHDDIGDGGAFPIKFHDCLRVDSGSSR